MFVTERELSRLTATELKKLTSNRKQSAERISEEAEQEGLAVIEMREEIDEAIELLGKRRLKRKKSKVPGWMRFKVMYHIK